MFSTNTYQIINIILIVAIGAIVSYFKTYVHINNDVSLLIVQAEKAYKDCIKAGKFKMQWCINKLYGYIPIWLKPIITEEILEDIIQNVFDNIQDYMLIKKDEYATNIQDAVHKLSNSVNTDINSKVQDIIKSKQKQAFSKTEINK